MESDKLKLPIGIEMMETMQKAGFYYVDKTRFIAELLNNWSQVNLFTRPRRFGKTLNMDMFKEFFDINKDSREIFKDLDIYKNTKLCDEWMNKYPVIFITLKDVDGLRFTDALDMFKILMARLLSDHYYLVESEKVGKSDKIIFDNIVNMIEDQATAAHVKNSLALLSRMMQAHFGKQVILLIDEYDVPLAKANDNGFYSEMLDVIRGMLAPALKTNPALKLAIITGCLRVSKESIFTGLNNLSVNTISNMRYGEYFGFTENEVETMLKYYGLEDYQGIIKEWYDGYLFGNTRVYCPWDVISYVSELRYDTSAEPKPYWINTSRNTLIRRLISRANQGTKMEIERLIEGDSISKEIRQELTYTELEDSIDNIWSVLYSTGYLTTKDKPEGGKYNLVIPNKEILEIYVFQIKKWFKEEVAYGNLAKLKEFCSSFKNGDAKNIEQLFTSYLKSTISLRDTFTNENKSNFYHGVLLGLLGSEDNWYVRSNLESGGGYCDIMIEMEDGIGCVVEVKYGARDTLEALCRKALRQIDEMDYIEGLKEEGVTTIYKYAIACFKKECKVMCEKVIM